MPNNRELPGLESSIQPTLQSLALVESKAAETGLRNLRKAARGKANTAFVLARQQFASGDNEAAIQSLLQAQDLVGNSRAIAHNLATANYRLKRFAETAAWLNVETQLSDPKERIRLAGLRTALITPGLVSQSMAAQAQSWNASLDKAPLQLRDVATTQPAACEQINSWPKDNAPATLFYNLAQCAQYAGQFEVAANYLDSYLRLAPDVLDAAACQRQLPFFRRMAALTGEQAAESQRLVGSALLQVRQQQPVAARKNLETADALVPNASALKERLATLAEWQGDFERAGALWIQAVDAEQAQSQGSSAKPGR